MALPTKTSVQTGQFSADGSPWVQVAAKSSINLDILELSKDGGPWYGTEDAASGGAFTLTASAGVFSITGIAAGLLLGAQIVAAQGSFVLTGQSAGLNGGRYVVADSGAYVFTGQSISFLLGRIFQSNSGTFTLTGQSSVLTYNQNTSNNQGIYHSTNLSVYSGDAAAGAAGVAVGKYYTTSNSHESLPAGIVKQRRS